MTFKVGDRIRRVSNAAPWAPIGYETVVMGVPGDLTYTDINGDIVILHVCDWEVIQEGPVRTVTRQEIVEGEYEGVTVGYTKGSEWVYVGLKPERYDADELDRAAAVLTALAGALRDAS